MVRFVTICALLLALFACSQQQETTSSSGSDEAKKVEQQIIVSDEVKAGWSAVKLMVKDLEKESEAVYTVPIGSSFKIPGSELRVAVDTFLPNFIITDGNITSRGLSTENPAVLIRVTEDDNQVFKGWLFELFQRSQSFSHPRYQLNLTGFVETVKKATAPVKKG